MFNIPSHQGNTNENYFDISSHISQNSYDKTKQMKSPHRTSPYTPENVEKRNLTHCWWVCKLVQSLWKSVWQFLNKIKCRTQMSHSWAYTQRSPCPTHGDRSISMYIAVQFTIARKKNQLSCHQLMNNEMSSINKNEIYRKNRWTENYYIKRSDPN